MKIKDINLTDISRFRAEQMGVAMVIVVLFHVALPRSDAFFGLRRMGNLGVDIFLFLSGMGLWILMDEDHRLHRSFLEKMERFLLAKARKGVPCVAGDSLFVLHPTLPWARTAHYGTMD